MGVKNQPWRAILLLLVAVAKRYEAIDTIEENGK
jgi:hypothetical protein